MTIVAGIAISFFVICSAIIFLMGWWLFQEDNKIVMKQLKDADEIYKLAKKKVQDAKIKD